MEYIDPTQGDSVLVYGPGCTSRDTEARLHLGRAADDDQTSRTKAEGCMTPTIVVRDVHQSLGDGGSAHRMGERVLQSDALGASKDLYFREVLIDLYTRTELALKLRMQTRIQVVPMEVTQ